MLGDFSIPGFKSHYSPLTSTSGPRLCERPLNLAPQGEGGQRREERGTDGENNLTNSVGTTGNLPDGNSHTQTRGRNVKFHTRQGSRQGVAVMKVKLYHLQFPIPIRSGGETALVIQCCLSSGSHIRAIPLFNSLFSTHFHPTHLLINFPLFSN